MPPTPCKSWFWTGSSIGDHAHSHGSLVRLVVMSPFRSRYLVLSLQTCPPSSLSVVKTEAVSVVAIVTGLVCVCVCVCVRVQVDKP